MSEIILIGLGGTGSNTVSKTVDLFEQRAGDEDAIHGLAVDLEEHGIGGGRVREFNGLEVEEPTSLVDHYWQEDEHFSEWWPTLRKDGEPYSSFRDLTSGSKAAQLRPNGRLASVMNFPRLMSELESTFEAPLEAVENTEGEREGLYVFLVSTLGGGTGSGILHDVAYLCREQMSNNDYLVGVFFDGTVVKSFAPKKTGILSYASLVEIDHWMRRPEDFFEVPALDHADTRSFWNQDRTRPRYLDFAFLVQEHNKNDLLLSGKSTGRIKGDYQKLASEWLYAFLQGDLLTRSDRDSRVFENIVPSHLHAAGDGRPDRYGSFGSTVLSVPVHKIADYLTAVRQDEAFTAWRNEDIGLKPGRAYLAEELDIDEGRESSLSRKWRQADLEAVDRLFEKLGTARELVENAESHDELENAVGSADLTSGGIESEWLRQLDAFEAAARTYLVEEGGLLDRITAEIDQEVNQSLLGAGEAGLPAHPSDAADWLESLGQGVESARQELERQKGNISLDPVGEAAAEVRDASLFQRLFRSGDLRNRVARGVSRLRRRVRQEELALMTEFYEELQQRLRQRIDFLGLLEDGLAGVESRAQEDRERFQFDDDIVNPEALREDEHPLELQVGTNKAYVEGVREELAERHVTAEQVVEPVVGGGPLADHSRWKGLARLYKDEIGEFVAVREEEGRGYDRAGLRTTIESRVRDILSEQVGNEVEKAVRENFDVEGALDSFLENKYDEASNYDPGDPADETVRERFEAHFGGEGARTLLAETEDRETWEHEALVHLFDRLVTFASPFWNQIEKYRRETLSSGGEVSRNILQIFVPRESSLDRRLQEAGVLDHIESPNDEPLAAFEDPYSLPIVQLEFGYPIHSVAELETDRARYLSHLRTWRSGESSGAPYHVDRRFYEEWSDDLSEPEPVHQQSQEEAFVLYVLGLGTGTIEVVSNGSNRYKFDGTTIESSVKGVIEELSDDRGLRQRLRADVFQDMSTALGNASQSTAARKEVWSTFHEGREIHGDLRPPQANEEHFRLWESIREAVEIRSLGDGEYRTDGRLVPTRPAEFEELRGRLRG